MRRLLPLAVLALLAPAGCVTLSENPGEDLMSAATPAIALDMQDQKLIVAVSPARRTLQIAGSYGTVIGATISGGQDEAAQSTMLEALGEYDPGAVLEETLMASLADSMGRPLEPVQPLGSTAGFRNRREAQDARYEAFDRRGIDLLLELDTVHGLFDVDARVLVKADGDLYTVPDGSLLWRDSIVVIPGPLLASDRLIDDPTQRLSPDLGAAGLMIPEGVIEYWAEDGGARYQAAHEAAVQGLVAALRTDLMLADEPLGHFYLGKQLALDEEFAEAATHMQRALELDPAFLPAQVSLAIIPYHNEENIEESIALTKSVVEATDHPAAHFNLAYLLAVELDDPETARAHYEAALAGGMRANRQIDAALAEAAE